MVDMGRRVSGWAMKLKTRWIRGHRKITHVVGAHLVIRSSMDRGSRIKVGSTTRLRSAPGRSWEMMCVRTVH